VIDQVVYDANHDISSASQCDQIAIFRAYVTVISRYLKLRMDMASTTPCGALVTAPQYDSRGFVNALTN
jgi:hypothetical protein